MTRNGYIKQIHTIAYRDLRLDEEQYREVVRNASSCGKESCGDLSLQDLELVLVAFRRLQRTLKPGAAVNAHVPSAPGRGNLAQHRMIARLMDLLGWDWSQTAKLCKRLTGHNNTRRCNAAELRALITAMVAMIEQNQASGKRTLPESELTAFRLHTRRHTGAEI